MPEAFLSYNDAFTYVSNFYAKNAAKAAEEMKEGAPKQGKLVSVHWMTSVRVLGNRSTFVNINKFSLSRLYRSRNTFCRDFEVP